jgi:hypothetical protein
MTEPMYGAFTERVYGSLPEVYRTQDVLADWPLKRWYAGILGQFQPIADLVERFDYTPANDLTPLQREELEGNTGEDITSTTFDPDPDSSWSLASGKWSLTVETTNAYVDNTLLLKGGTYQLTVSYDRGPNQGIASLRINNDEVAVLDQYAAAPDTVTSAPIEFNVSRGYHSFRFVFTGTKNASSSDEKINARSVRVVNTSAEAVDTSDLVDAASADDSWLPWLGQLFGVDLAPGLNVIERRDAVRYASSGFKAGSKPALGDAVRSELTGTKSVAIYDHSTDAPSGVGAGTQWEVLIVTRSSETPAGGAAILDAVARKGAKPAGVKLYHKSVEATWATIEATYPTWADWETKTWSQIEETGL